MVKLAEKAMKTAVQVFQNHSKGKQVTGIINGLPETNKYLGPVIKEIKRYWEQLENIKTIEEEVKKQAVIMKKDGKEKVSEELDKFKTDFQNNNKAIILELNEAKIMAIINPVPGITGSLIKFILDNSKDPKVTSEKLYDEFLTIGKAAVEAAEKKALDAVKKKAPATPANKATATTAPKAANKSTAPASTEKQKDTTTTASTFGKRKRGPSASLKRMCKKHGVRLMVKRGKTRVYKSSKVLKEQCKNKLKKNKKKNFGRKKIKRSGIMPPRKRKTRGKKRRKQKGGAAKLAQILKASARRQAKKARRGARSAARYARRNPRRAAGYAAAGLTGLGALGLGGFEAKRARERYLLEKANPYFSRTRRSGGEERLQSIDHLQEYQGYKAQRKALESPTGRFVRGVRDYDYRGAPRRAYTGATTYPYRQRAGEFYTGAKAAPGAAYTRAGEAYTGAKTKAGKAYSGFMGLFKSKPPTQAEYGKRRRRRRKKRSFGKKAKKPSAALKKMCKKHKVRLTLKRGGKRVYKSEGMLKKQCKKAMKRKKRKSKK